MCKRVIIELHFCLCAFKLLLKLPLANVQYRYYRKDPLLMCIYLIIERSYCLCAEIKLLTLFYCWCARASLLSKSIAGVQNLLY